MRFVKANTHIDFIGKKAIAFSISLALIVVSLVYLVVHGGPKAGIDFSGGTLIQVQFSGTADAQTIRTALESIEMEGATVQNYGKDENNEFLIRSIEPDTDMNEHEQKLTAALDAATGLTSEIRRVEMVGPQVGKELREKAAKALFYALLFITIYISGRFEAKWLSSGIMVVALILCVSVFSAFGISINILIIIAMLAAIGLFWLLNLKYSMGAIVALLHDILITVGIFSMLGREFSLSIVAALLTIVGYSLNDTIIVYDRIRENLKLQRKDDFKTIINSSINGTLSRTILTSGTTMVVLLALFIFGGDIINDFAMTMIIGVLVGTYSSIYVASPILLAWEKKGK
jgi:preprotein translocase subunit SecF